MPDSNVTVTATFKQKPAATYTVTVTNPENANGTISASVSSAVAGTEITLTNTAKEGYELDAYAVVDANGAPVTVENGKFLMPNSNVIVTATFKTTSVEENPPSNP